MAKEAGLERSFRETAPLAMDRASKAPVSESVALTAGGIAALLAGACCVAPLVLVTAGLGGAWLANLQLLEPYQPVFVTAALAALGFAGWRIYRPVAECKPGDICAVPRIRRGYKFGFWMVGALLAVMLGLPSLAPLFY